MIRSRIQRKFFGAVADPQSLCEIFEHLPGVFFFAKDRESRLIAASSHMVARFGVKREADIVGKFDDAFFPEHMARAFRVDDEQVFQTKKPLLNRLEVLYDDQHTFEWYVTTKLPLLGKNGEVVGLIGVTSRDEGRLAQQPVGEISRAVGYLQQHANRIVSPAELAHVCGVSERTLYRKINQSLGITPYELTLRIRVQEAAKQLIKTRTKINEIAQAYGFCDQSTFGQHFRKRIGSTPRQFRARNAD